jgi:hypothetical protein
MEPIAGLRRFNSMKDTVHIAVSAISVPSGQPRFVEIPTLLKSRKTDHGKTRLRE